MLLCLLYSLTTPTGIAIGIGIRESWNENTSTALITMGVLDSLSAGVLIYAVLVEVRAGGGGVVFLGLFLNGMGGVSAAVCGTVPSRPAIFARSCV